MAEQYVICPQCNSEIPLTKAITSQIEQQLRNTFENEYKERFDQAEKQYSEQIEQLKVEAKRKAAEEIELEINDLKNQIAEKSEKLKKAQENELSLRERQREIDEKIENFELEFARKVGEEKKKIEEELKKKLDDDFRLKEADKDKQIADMRRQIDELKRKAEQGSQQTQGEVLEIELENVLKQKFPFDQIEPVPKGLSGADLIHKVCNDGGIYCGTIVWETKRTKNWSNSWIPKLKDDKLKVNAEIGAILTQALPDGIKNFGHLEGIWVTDYYSLYGVATALRMHLIQINNERVIQTGKEGKKEILYNYLSGQEFRQKVTAIAESFIQMQHDLEKEKRAMQRIWAKREKQIERVFENTSRIYGDLEGIIGKPIFQIEGYDLEALPEGEEE